jgi:hypothetical protein
MMPRKQAWLLAKMIAACAAITAIVSVPAHRLAPGLSLLALAAMLLCAFAGLVLLTVVSLTVAQFVLRCGGTDPQWFWFKGEPPGLQAQRGLRRVEWL